MISGGNRGAGVRMGPDPPPPPPPNMHLKKRSFISCSAYLMKLSDVYVMHQAGSEMSAAGFSTWVETAVTSRRAWRLDRSTFESETVAPAPTATVRGSAPEKQTSAASAAMSCEIAEPRLASGAAACGKSLPMVYFPVTFEPVRASLRRPERLHV